MNVDVLSTFKEYVAVAFVSVKVLLDAVMFPTWPTTSSAPTGGAPITPGVNGITVVPALKSSPIVAVSRSSRLTSIRSPVVPEDAIVNPVRGIVVDKFAVAVGAIVQIEPTAQDPITLAVSFSIVSIGFAKVRVTAVKLPAGIFAAVARYAMSV